MIFDLSDGINNILEYQILNNDCADERLVEAFKSAWRSGDRRPPTIILDELINKLDINPDFLTVEKIMKITQEVERIINE